MGMMKIICRHKFWFCITIISIIGLTVQELLKAYLMQFLLDAVTCASLEYFYKACLFTGLFVIYMIMSSVFYDFSSNRFIQVCRTYVKEQWFEEILRKPLYNYDVQNVSSYISNFTTDIVMLEEDYLKNVLLIFQYLFTGITSLIAILDVHYIFVVFILCTSWIPPLVNYLWGDKLTSVKMKASQMNGIFVASLKETLMGFEVSKLFGISEHMLYTFRKKNTATEQAQYSSRFVKDIASSCSGTTSMGIWFGTLLLGIFLASRGHMTVGSIIKVNQLLNNITTPLYSISTCHIKMKAADQVYKHINMELLEQNLVVQTDVRNISEFMKNIEIKNLKFECNNRKILDHINIQFQKGKKYLLMGESGSGKSTLIKILMNAYNNYQGLIYIDNTDFRQINKESWYHYLSVVGQDGFVFRNTIRNNITLFQYIAEEKIQKVLSICCLTDFVNSHQEGLDFVIEENGKNISGGERQRICLARALLKDAPILILDEATSALNAEMAMEIEKNLLALKHITLISISHKIFPEIVSKYDSVIYFGKFGIKQKIYKNGEEIKTL